ncbi:uncharacterized protein [Rutidosis leptorrhynchoides]|uniref:uncharacterized protein n=1 Tax=Rutidosis leptorrhynchoides TaxID=125765 RepID=UPI003A9958C1
MNANDPDFVLVSPFEVIAKKFFCFACLEISRIPVSFVSKGNASIVGILFGDVIAVAKSTSELGNVDSLFVFVKSTNPKHIHDSIVVYLEDDSFLMCTLTNVWVFEVSDIKSLDRLCDSFDRHSLVSTNRFVVSNCQIFNPRMETPSVANHPTGVDHPSAILTTNVDGSGLVVNSSELRFGSLNLPDSVGPFADQDHGPDQLHHKLCFGDRLEVLKNDKLKRNAVFNGHRDEGLVNKESRLKMKGVLGLSSYPLKDYDGDLVRGDTIQKVFMDSHKACYFGALTSGSSESREDHVCDLVEDKEVGFFEELEMEGSLPPSVSGIRIGCGATNVSSYEIKNRKGKIFNRLKVDGVVVKPIIKTRKGKVVRW